MKEEDVNLVHKYAVNFQENPIAQRYMRSRGIHDWDLCGTLKIGWTGRAFSIPYYKDGEMWNVKYRIHPDYRMDGEPKYMGHSRPYPSLWPHDYVLSTDDRGVLLLTEGELDALLLLQYDITAVSLPSGSSSVSGILRYRSLLSKWERVWVFFDQDEAGQKAREEMEKPQSKYEGKSLVALLGAEVTPVFWSADKYGKDVTDAREFLVPKIRELLNE
jgi:hypothetical protein